MSLLSVLRVGFPRSSVQFELHALERRDVSCRLSSLATGFAPSWVAADKGIWKKHGLDVELIFLRGGSRTVSALIGGSVDFIIGSDLGVTTAILQGAALTRVGVTTNTLGYSMVTQPGIKTVRDLRGKIVGITPGRDAAYARVVKLLRDNGMDASRDVTFLSVGDGGPAARGGGPIQRRHSRDHVLRRPRIGSRRKRACASSRRSTWRTSVAA